MPFEDLHLSEIIEKCGIIIIEKEFVSYSHRRFHLNILTKMTSKVTQFGSSVKIPFVFVPKGLEFVKNCQIVQTTLGRKCPLYFTRYTI